MLQLTDDEEALKDEEEEAQRLQRQAAEQLQPEDFEQEEDGLEASSSSDEEADTMGAKARQVRLFPKKTYYLKPREIRFFGQVKTGAKTYTGFLASHRHLNL